jgi:5,10-methylene-tetrahydrofolate dehydrogenase/methenyl tetrahydrofolate cyclohydrolase
VRNKKKACDECGMASFGTDLPEDATEQEARALPCPELLWGEKL